MNNLYLGNNQNGLDYPRYGFTHVVNVTKNNNRYPISNVWLKIDDIETSDLYSHLDKITSLIHNKINNGEKVLVHCQAGISRSATVVIAYVMRSKRYTLQDAFKYVKQRRPIVSPNRGFFAQLGQFERWLNSTNGYFTSPT
jgi:protein-tyrosine phosphatase